MLCCDIVLDFYPVKLPKKFGVERNCEDIKFQVLQDFVKFHGKRFCKFHGKLKVFLVLK